MSLERSINQLDRAEHQAIEQARREGFDGNSILELNLWRAELAEAAERAAKVNTWASGALFGSRQPTTTTAVERQS